MATSRNRKPSSKTAKPATRKSPAKSRTVAGGMAKLAKAAKKVAPKAVRKPAKVANAKPVAKAKPAKTAGSVAAKPVAKNIRITGPAVKSATPRPASVKTAARAVAAARANAAAKRRPPSYIPRSHFNDDWMLSGPAELPRQPTPAAHAPTRKPPKPRAPKPKAISHEQAVANLKALLESRKRKDRGGSVAAGKGA